MGQQALVVGHVTEVCALDGLRSQLGTKLVSCRDHCLVGRTEVTEMALRHAVGAQLLAQINRLTVVRQLVSAGGAGFPVAATQPGLVRREIPCLVVEADGQLRAESLRPDDRHVFFFSLDGRVHDGACGFERAVD